MTTSQALLNAWSDYHATLDEMRLAVEATPICRDQPQHRAKALWRASDRVRSHEERT